LRFGPASADALAQGAGDAMEKLRACSLLAPAELRLAVPCKSPTATGAPRN
jgi:hypothetical protein